MPNEKTSHTIQQRRFVSERELSPIVGRSVKTLQKDRFFGKSPFPFYRLNRQILYDVGECIAILERTRVDGGRGIIA